MFKMFKPFNGSNDFFGTVVQWLDQLTMSGWNLPSSWNGWNRLGELHVCAIAQIRNYR